MGANFFIQIRSKVYFAANESKTNFEKIVEMDKTDLHFPFFLPAFLYPAL